MIDNFNEMFENNNTTTVVVFENYAINICQRNIRFAVSNIEVLIVKL